jgi:hypothetical protein
MLVQRTLGELQKVSSVFGDAAKFGANREACKPLCSHFSTLPLQDFERCRKRLLGLRLLQCKWQNTQLK